MSEPTKQELEDFVRVKDLEVDGMIKAVLLNTLEILANNTKKNATL
ncbi:hypothetical protein ACWEWU_14275 [Staphylococcus xylosus]|nr:hypothetical protein [Staphylococcus xylosus]